VATDAEEDDIPEGYVSDGAADAKRRPHSSSPGLPQLRCALKPQMHAPLAGSFLALGRQAARQKAMQQPSCILAVCVRAQKQTDAMLGGRCRVCIQYLHAEDVFLLLRL